MTYEMALANGRQPFCHPGIGPAVGTAKVPPTALTSPRLVWGFSTSLTPLFRPIHPKEAVGSVRTMMSKKVLVQVTCMLLLALPPAQTQPTTGCANLWIFESIHDAGHAVIPDVVPAIRAHEFEGCTSLTSVTISDSVTNIGARAFFRTGLTSVTLPNAVTYIGPRAFMDCDNLTTASLPNALTHVPIALFYSCDILSVLNISDSVTQISSLALAECPSLTSISIPSTAVNISGSAFAHNSCPAGAYIAGAVLCNCTSCHRTSPAITSPPISDSPSNIPTVSPTTLPTTATTATTSSTFVHTSSSTTHATQTSESPSTSIVTTSSPLATSTVFTPVTVTTPGTGIKPTTEPTEWRVPDAQAPPMTTPPLLNPIQSPAPASKRTDSSKNSAVTIIACVFASCFFVMLVVGLFAKGKRHDNRARNNALANHVDANWVIRGRDDELAEDTAGNNDRLDNRGLVLCGPAADSAESDDTELRTPEDTGAALATQTKRLDLDQRVSGRNMPEALGNFRGKEWCTNLPLVVVASCPHTVSLDNVAPFHIVDNTRVFDVFEHCKHLQSIGVIRTAHDCAGSASASVLDKDVIWSLNDPRLDTFNECEKWQSVKESVSKSVWFACYQANIRSAIRQIAQAEPSRPIRLICIQGGPITEVEHEYMSKIVTDGRRDATIFGSTDIRITIDFCCYKEFRQEFPSTPYLLHKSASVYFGCVQ